MSLELDRAHADVEWKVLAPWFAAGLAFVVLFWEPVTTLARDWWTLPEAGHGLLLCPVAAWLMWRAGLAPARPQPSLGFAILTAALVLRYLSGLAAELFTMRASALLAAAGLVVSARGAGQLRRWSLPLVLLALSIPIPAVLLGSIALPLQLKASELGATLLAARHVPVRLAGNILYLPNRALFVTEACSGLRSLTALLALGVLAGGVWLVTLTGRLALVLLAIPIAIALNAVRIFVTGFLVYYVDPRLADGFLHLTEGWAIFVIAFSLLGVMAWGLGHAERMLS